MSLMLLAPAAAQPSANLMDRTAAADNASFPEHTLSKASAPTVHVPMISETSRGAETITLRRRVGVIASTVVSVLVAQNAIGIGPPGDSDPDAYLRSPAEREAGPSIFQEARALYDDVTRFETKHYDLSVDPLSLKCRLRVRLGH